MSHPMQDSGSPPPPRRSSLGMLLRRTKSGDLARGQRKASKEQQQRPRQNSISKSPPKLPDFFRGADKLSTAFPQDLHPDTASVMSGNVETYSARPSIDPGRSFVSTIPIPPVPPVPSSAWDPYARTESMTHRGRYSYASSAMSTINSPRRVRRRKDPTPFNILVVGTKNAGKTSFLEFLKLALTPPPKKRSRKTIHEDEETVNNALSQGHFMPHYLETELEGERVGLTIWDSEGFEKNVVDLQLRELSLFVESKFEETFNEEMKVVRSPGIRDTHIHAVFLVLDPSRLDRNLASAKSLAAFGFDARYASTQPLGALDDDLDLQVLRTLQGKTTVIPVISKADTVTTKHMMALKKSVWESLKKAGLDPLEALGIDTDEDSAIDTSRIDELDEDVNSSRSTGNGSVDLPMHAREPSSPNSKRLSGNSIRRHKAQEQAKEDEDVPFLPMSVISPDLYEPSVIGRRFPWGFADPYNDAHCDFTRLKESVFTEWRSELREASREQWYEGWRTNRLNSQDFGGRIH